MEQRNKFLSVLTSRKFWYSLLSILGAVGVLNFSEAQMAELAAMIVAGGGAVLVVMTGLEDGLRGFGAQGEVIVVDAPEVTVLDEKGEVAGTLSVEVTKG